MLKPSQTAQEPYNRIRKELIKECKQLGPGQRVLVLGNSRWAVHGTLLLVHTACAAGAVSACSRCS